MVTDLVTSNAVASTSSSVKSASRTTASSTPSGSGKSLTVLAAACREQYTVAGAPVAIARKVVTKEKTAANMGERIRERALQLEREKEARKVVVVDDASLLASQAGKKGKGKGKASTLSKASPLLKATSSLSVKRTASPAGSPKNSPQLGATKMAARQTSRLVASEAAKGLMSRKEKEVAEQQAAIEAESRAKSALQQNQTVKATSGANLAVKPSSSAPQTASEKVRVASSASSTSSYSSTSTAMTQASSATSIASNPVASTAAKSIGPPPITQASSVMASGLARPGQQQRYYSAKVDEDDLASASSDSEDEDAKPLAKKGAQPMKASDSVQIVKKAPATQPVAAAEKAAKPKLPTASSPQMRASHSKGQAAVATSSATQATRAPEAAVSQSESPKLGRTAIVRPRSDLAPSAQSVAVSSSTSRSSSSSSRSEPLAQAPAKRKRSVSTDKAAGNKPAKRKTSEEKSPKSSAKSEVPVKSESVKEKETAPRVQARTSGGARLSKPLPRRSPDSRSISPARVTSGGDAVLAGPAEKKRSATPPLVVAADPEAKGTEPQSQSKVRPQPSLSLSIPPATSPAPSSRNTSPLPSPSSLTHALPVKPVVTSASADQERGFKFASTRTTPSGNETGRLSVPASPKIGPRTTSIIEASGRPLPASLPARPSTVMPPTGGRSNSFTKKAAPNSEGHAIPVTVQVNSGHAVSSSGTNSPIVSHFPRKDQEAVVSPMSQKRKSDASDLSDTSGRPAKAPRSAAVFAPEIAAGKAEQTDEGEEDADGEIEEGEEDGQVDSFIDEGHAEGQPRGRSADQKAVAASSTERKTRMLDKSGLPSFSKKSRTGQLMAAESGRSLSRSQNGSRAATPNDANPSSRESSPAVSKERASLKIAIKSDADYRVLAQRFSDELFPAYIKVHKKLDEIKENLRHEARKGIATAVSPADLARMVGEANAKGEELKAIKEAMAVYNRAKQGTA